MKLVNLLLLSLSTLTLAVEFPKCDDTSPARADWTNDCFYKLVASGSDTIDVSDAETLVCFKVFTEPLGRGGGTYSSSVVVGRRAGHDSSYTTTKLDVACAVMVVLQVCNVGDNLTGGREVVCNSDDLYIEVKGQGNK